MSDNKNITADNIISGKAKAKAKRGQVECGVCGHIHGKNDRCVSYECHLATCEKEDCNCRKFPMWRNPEEQKAKDLEAIERIMAFHNRK
jgi:hypothetical protein